MVCAQAFLPAPTTGCRLACRIKCSSVERTSPQPRLSGTGNPTSNGNSCSNAVPFKLKLKFKSEFENNSFAHFLLRKLSTRDWISFGRSDARDFINWGTRKLEQFRCFIIPWSWISWMISVYLFCLNYVSEAHDYPYSSFGYACQNVQKYYAGTEKLRGEALKQKLYSVVSRHQSLSYKKVLDALKILDAADVDKPEASLEIVEIYSLKAVAKNLAGKQEGWNREHLWPRSYGLTSSPSLTDLHNIRPADVNVNSSRGNKFFGECHLNSYACQKPATKEAAPDTETDKEIWAPPILVRGDIARAVMYMAVCYGSNQSNGGLNLHLSDSPSIANSEMGMLSILLRWNEVDPPSREEKLRNERICEIYQHNRNPFVDHPEYAGLIWKQIV